MHIAIAGNIGSGKTTLTKMLSSRMGWTPRFESVEFNPYLTDFYEDMSRWSFNIQMYFLNRRFKDIVEISHSGDAVVQDRTIYEDACIFAPNLMDMGLLSSRDFETYSELFDTMMSLMPKPDLLIYLRASLPTLLSQIRKRGRAYEQGISMEYLSGLNAKYEQWAASYDGNILVVDTDSEKFEENPADFEKVVKKINNLLKINN